MGAFESTRRKLHLSQDEIELMTNQNTTLQIYFNQYKNANGTIVLKDLENIFEKKIGIKQIKKIFKIAAAEKGKFNFLDLKYLYALFTTNNYDAKLNFITDLVFVNKNNITVEGYKKSINMIFSDFNPIYSKLSNPSFINNMTSNNKILRDNFFKNLDSQFKTYFTNFMFLKNEEESNNDVTHNNNDNKLILTSNQFTCECINNRSKVKLITESIQLNTMVYYISKYRNMREWRMNLGGLRNRIMEYILYHN